MNYLECASKIDALCSGSPLTRIEYNLDEDNAVSIIQTRTNLVQRTGFWFYSSTKIA